MHQDSRCNAITLPVKIEDQLFTRFLAHSDKGCCGIDTLFNVICFANMWRFPEHTVSNMQNYKPGALSKKA